MSNRPTPPQLNQLSVSLERRLDWSELDVLGHANNARYFTWFEEARMAYFQAVGIPTVNGQDWGPILAYTDCHFLAPVVWPADLILGAQVIKVGRSSLTMTYGVFLKNSTPTQSQDQISDPICVAHGQGVIVLVDYRSGAKLEVNPTLRKKIEEIESENKED